MYKRGTLLTLMSREARQNMCCAAALLAQRAIMSCLLVGVLPLTSTAW